MGEVSWMYGAVVVWVKITAVNCCSDEFEKVSDVDVCRSENVSQPFVWRNDVGDDDGEEEEDVVDARQVGHLNGKSDRESE